MGTNFDILDSLVDSFLKSSGMKEREFTNWLYARLGKALFQQPESPAATVITPENPAIEPKEDDPSPTVGSTDDHTGSPPLPEEEDSSSPNMEPAEENNSLSHAGLTVGEFKFACLTGNQLSLFDEMPPGCPEDEYFGLALNTGTALIVISLVPVENIEWQTTKDFVERIIFQGEKGTLPDENIFDAIKKLNPEDDFNKKVRILNKKGIEADKWEGSVLGPERYGNVRIFNLKEGKSLSPKSCIAGIVYRVGIMFHIN